MGIEGLKTLTHFPSPPLLISSNMHTIPTASQSDKHQPKTSAAFQITTSLDFHDSVVLRREEAWGP